MAFIFALQLCICTLLAGIHMDLCLCLETLNRAGIATHIEKKQCGCIPPTICWVRESGLWYSHIALQCIIRNLHWLNIDRLLVIVYIMNRITLLYLKSDYAFLLHSHTIVAFKFMLKSTMI
jgi:hypothetical protein